VITSYKFHRNPFSILAKWKKLDGMRQTRGVHDRHWDKETDAETTGQDESTMPPRSSDYRSIITATALSCQQETQESTNQSFATPNFTLDVLDDKTAKTRQPILSQTRRIFLQVINKQTNKQTNKHWWIYISFWIYHRCSSSTTTSYMHFFFSYACHLP